MFVGSTKSVKLVGVFGDMLYVGAVVGSRGGRNVETKPLGAFVTEGVLYVGFCLDGLLRGGFCCSGWYDGGVLGGIIIGGLVLS